MKLCGHILREVMHGILITSNGIVLSVKSFLRAVITFKQYKVYNVSFSNMKVSNISRK